MAHPTRIFLEASQMAEAWELFKEDLKEQGKDWPKVQYVGKDGTRVIDEPVLPKTLEGFKRFCRTHYGEIEQYFSNQDALYGDFIGICSQIREEIREHQIVGGMVGAFNPSITQRLNNLVEKTENKHEIQEINVIMNLKK